MKNLKIRVFRAGRPEPETTVTIPAGVVRVASRLVPARAREALHDKGIDVEELVRLAGDPEVRGTLVEIEEHRKDERIVVSLE